MNDQYGVQMGNSAQIVPLRNSLSTIKLVGSSTLTSVIEKLDSIFITLQSAGDVLNEKTKRQYLHNSLCCPGSTLNQLLLIKFMYLYENEEDFLEISTQLRVLESIRKLENEMSKVSSDIQVHSATVSNKQKKKGGKNGKCSKCGGGHSAANCWKDTVCTFCNSKGHPAERCWSNPDGNNFRPDQSSNKKARLEDTEEVRLQSMFKQKVDKMHKK